jgi:hypothetical protein
VAAPSWVRRRCRAARSRRSCRLLCQPFHLQVGFLVLPFSGRSRGTTLKPRA